MTASAPTARALAFQALGRWRGGREFADRIIQRSLAEASLGSSDRAFAQELFYGVLRNLTLLDFWIGQLRPSQIEAAARDLLRLGLYQVLLIQTSPHAAVFETVKLAPDRLRKLINAVLRRAVREQERLKEAAQGQPVHLQWSEPEFLVEKWSRQFGAEAALELCAWNNRPAPVYARINRLKISVPDFLQRYRPGHLLPEQENFVLFPGTTNAIQSGDCYVQDPSTTLACELLGPAPGETVLDACAAPGGKSAQLAEMMANQGTLIAADRDAQRLARLRENLLRLGVTNARVIDCDWREPGAIEAAGLLAASFDKILVDAPCTNTGVMRRRVDLRWRLRPDDFARMAAQQLEILHGVAPFLRRGGLLVYSTCSLEQEENRAVVERFLKEARNFRLTSWRESFPFRDQFDGAYAALLSRSG
jgi:16S rRNA (cytosine967-C5)-methyltransferase